jgi:hypothetical protein
MKKLACLIMAALFSLSVVFADEPVRYTSETVARLSFIDGNVYIQRAIEIDYEEALLNMPVTEGDRMGTTLGRAEIYMGRGKYLRLDHHTKIDFLSLPDFEKDLTRIQLWRGNILLSIFSLKKEKAIEIHTEDASLYILEAGLYRIDVKEEETEILVFRGLLEAAGESGSILVRESMRIEALNGRFLGRPESFVAAAEDSFDRWSEGRDYEVRKRMARSYLPAELEDFEYELALYGKWAYVFPYGNVWIPGGIVTDWRPYWHGRWMWTNVCGWIWLPYEPWGWATFHYGRWHWSAGFGWYWIPTTVWGPGWVHWYGGHDYIGWAPMSYWGRPGVVIENHYYGRFTDRHYPRHSRALTVIHRDQLKARNISKVALSQNSVKNIERLSLRKTQPVAMQDTGTKIRLKALQDAKTSTRDFSSETLRRVKIQSPEKTKSTVTRNIPKSSTETKTRKTSTTLGKITSALSRNKSKEAKSRSSSGSKSSASKINSSKSSSSKASSSKSSSAKRSPSKSSSSKKIKSSSLSKASSKSKSSSPAKSSSRTRSTSKKVKKKK